MEQRKIMALGRSSLVVSLPKRWLKLNGLERGDVVSLDIQRDNSLVLFSRAKKKREVQKITLKVDPTERKKLLVRRIIACYLNGYSGITVISTDIFTAVQQKAIRDIIRMLYMRILESDARRIYIQTLIDESKAPVETAVRRMYIVSSSMCQDALKSLRDQDVELARVVHGLDDDVDHLCFFLLRLLRGAVLNSDLARDLALEPIDCLDYQTLVHRIEHVADLTAAIADNVIMASRRGLWISPSVLESLLDFGGQAFNIYNEAMKAFFSGDTAASNEVIDRINEVEKLNQRIALSTVTMPDALTVCMMCIIRDSIRRIAEYAADVAEITINHSYKPTPQLSKATNLKD